MIDPKTRIIAALGSLALLIFIIELVRRRRLKEEYSVLWTVTAVTVFIVTIWVDLLFKVTKIIGAVAPASTLFFLGLLFVMMMLLHFSVRVSSLERNLTALIQELGILSVERKNGQMTPEEAESSTSEVNSDTTLEEVSASKAKRFVR